MSDSVDRPELPRLDFDWPPEMWQDVGGRLLEMAASAATGWNERRPSPAEEVGVRAHFRDPLPERPVAVDHLPAYLDEMAFRFNNRHNPFLFRDTLKKLIEAATLPYQDLTA